MIKVLSSLQSTRAFHNPLTRAKESHHEDPHGSHLPRQARQHGPQDRLLARGVRRALLHLSRCRSDRDVASPKGGQPPLDPVSDTPEGQTELTRRFKQDPAAQAVLANTLRLSDVKVSDYDAVFYPGGHSPMWDLAEDPRSIALIEAFYSSGKPVAAVCHAPGVLHRVQFQGQPIVKGKRVTGFTNGEEEAVHLTKVVPFLVEDELKRLGGLYEKVANWVPFVVTDGRLVTGQNPASSRRGAEALLKLLA